MTSSAQILYPVEQYERHTLRLTDAGNNAYLKKHSSYLAVSLFFKTLPETYQQNDINVGFKCFIVM